MLKSLLIPLLLIPISCGVAENVRELVVDVPRYFLKLPQARIDSEISYYAVHVKWSQRVALENLHQQIIGRTVDRNADNGGLSPTDDGMYQHPRTGEFEYFKNGSGLNWDDFEYEGIKTICEKWEGISCHERVDNGLETTCWCISDLEWKEYNWADNSDSTWEDCTKKCRKRGMIGKNQAPLDAVTRILLSGHNLVGGMLPDEISHLKFLEVVNLSSNHLIGSFPTSLGSLEGLKIVDFSSNDLMGGFDEVEPMPSLIELLLADTNVNGTIPEFILGCTELRLLDLSDNALSGTIPERLFDLTKLAILDLNNNKLSGTLPRAIRKLINVEELLMQGNKLTGTIPTEISHCKTLQTLILQTNELSGAIPLEIAQLPNLERLIMGFNKLTSIPPEWPDTHGIEWISLRQNELRGTIPPSIFNYVLTRLDVAENQLTGTIPHQIKESKLLHLFHVTDNKLTGTLPSELFHLKELRNLEIYDNR